MPIVEGQWWESGILVECHQCSGEKIECCLVPGVTDIHADQMRHYGAGSLQTGIGTVVVGWPVTKEVTLAGATVAGKVAGTVTW